MVKFSVPPTQMVPVAGGFAGIGEDAYPCQTQRLNRPLGPQTTQEA
jgi:hypothetical protein